MGKSQSAKRIEKSRKFLFKKENLEGKITKNSENLIKTNAFQESQNASIYRVKMIIWPILPCNKIYIFVAKIIDIWESGAILSPRFEGLTGLQRLLRTSGSKTEEIR
jgi:hypothetical protein